MTAIITLLSDFGTRDAYVASMKGAILSIAPDARIVDISHEVAPQDVTEGAWLLAAAFRAFPPGTVHMAVVDPGVGSERRGLAAQAGGWRFVGPDNGVLTWALELAGTAQAVELVDPRYFRPQVSATFHGRDIFAPVAAHLASGVALDALGPRVGDLASLAVPQLRPTPEAIGAEVVHVDRFGNLITNADAATLELWRQDRPLRVEIAGTTIDGVRSTYADVAPGEVVALIESSGHLEIAVREGDAAQVLGVGRGAPVTVTRG